MPAETIIDWTLVNEAPERTFEEAALLVYRETRSARIAAENLETLRLMAAEETRPWQATHPFVPPLIHNEWALGFIAICERWYHANNKNPVFASQARQARRWLTANPSSEVYEACLKWIDDHFDEADRRLIALAERPPSRRDPAIAKALGFSPVKRGGVSEFDVVNQAWSDDRVSLLVELRLPVNNGKQRETFEEVASFIGKSRSTVRLAYLRYLKLKGQ